MTTAATAAATTPNTQATTNNEPSRANNALKGLSDNFDQFLLMLTTQLQNQDPLSPMDTHEFTQQIVQFSGVEQAIETNSHLEALLALQDTSEVGEALGYIDRIVDFESEEIALGPQGGDYLFFLDRPVEKATLTVYGPGGNVLGKKEIPAAQGFNSGSLLLEEIGGALGPGNYNYTIDYTDFAGESGVATTYASGKVREIRLNNDGQPRLIVDGREIAIEDIATVRIDESASATNEQHPEDASTEDATG